MLDTLPFTIPALHAAYAEGTKLSDIVKECFRRIDEVGDPGIFIHLFDEADVVAGAQSLGAFDPVAKPLWGIPFVIKDNIDAANAPTTAGCPAYAYEPEGDAFVVKQLRAAGAILIGKTNLDQFATGLVGVRSPFTPPKNSIDPSIVPGGSSSGSGVSVGHGFVTFSLGTDTAGSGRVPAALNNVVGLKPTLGTLSASGVVPACRTLDTVSIFALTVEDAYAAFAQASVFDPQDAYSRAFPSPALGVVQPSFKVGVPSKETRRFYSDTIQEAAFDVHLQEIEALGGRIIELDFEPLYEIAWMLYEGTWVAERYTVIEDLLKSDPDAIHPATTTIIKNAEKFSAADAFRNTYKFMDLKRSVEPALASVDVVCVPSIPTFYTVDDLVADPFGPNNNNGTYTNFVNLLDMSAIAVPMAARSDGRPGSVTLIGGAGEDAKIASLASALHQRAGVLMGTTPHKVQPLDVSASVATSDEIALVVAGAHMSGLPLNSELTKLGGRFLKACKTAPDYQLYAIAGGPPFRPGLVRSKDGAALDIEVWALPKAAFAAFMEGIPAPLGIGTVALEDGSSAKGFICEPIGLDGARDVTSFGGWRAFITSSQNETAA